MSKHVTIFIENQGSDCNVKVYTSPDMDSSTLTKIRKAVNPSKIKNLLEVGINTLKEKEASHQ